jgi:uncharacterized protein
MCRAPIWHKLIGGLITEGPNMSVTSLNTINEFFAQKRLAMVGVSRDPKDFSRALYNEFRKRGYDVVPVNPNTTEIEGAPCYKRVQDIQPAVDAVFIVTPPQVTEQVVRDAAEAGVKYVWMQRGEGIGSVSDSAVAFCEQQGMRVVPGQCPFMFLPKSPFFHRIHGWVKKLQGAYPA